MLACLAIKWYWRINMVFNFRFWYENLFKIIPLRGRFGPIYHGYFDSECSCTCVLGHPCLYILATLTVSVHVHVCWDIHFTSVFPIFRLVFGTVLMVIYFFIWLYKLYVNGFKKINWTKTPNESYMIMDKMKTINVIKSMCL
jgi:hypothetical protein